MICFIYDRLLRSKVIEITVLKHKLNHIEQNFRITKSMMEITPEMLLDDDLDKLLNRILLKAIENIPRAQSGSILIKDGNGVVQTKKKYSDFVLEFEWKALKDDKWDSGVYFRYDSIPENKPWPARYQANLRKGDEGNVGGLKYEKPQGLFKNGEWNTFKLTVRGTAVEMEMNGKPAWKADGLEGPKEGFICLQAEVPGGGQCLFRNIYVTEIK